MDIKIPFYNIILNMHVDNKLQLRIEDKLSTVYESKIGVRQTDKVSPYFYNSFVIDVPNKFSEADDQVELDNFKISSLLYADDLMLLSN